MTDGPMLLEMLGLSRDRDAGTVACTVERRHRQSNGVVHGSVIHALLDTAMGIACYRAAGKSPVATAEISIRYLVPVFDGRLDASARVVKAGKRLIVVEGDVHRSGERVAIGQATFVPIRAS